MGARAAAHARKLSPGSSTTTIDLNTASAEELTRLPGVGPGRARLIVARRAKRPFRTTQELAALKGIGPKLFRKIRTLVRVELPPTRGGANRPTGSADSSKRPQQTPRSEGEVAIPYISGLPP